MSRPGSTARPGPVARDDSSVDVAGLLVLATANAVTGLVCGVPVVLVYFALYVIAAAAGWVPPDPTVVDDFGEGGMIGLGATALLFVVGMFLGPGLVISRRRRMRPRHWLPVATLVFALSTWVGLELVIP